MRVRVCNGEFDEKERERCEYEGLNEPDKHLKREQRNGEEKRHEENCNHNECLPRENVPKKTE